MYLVNRNPIKPRNRLPILFHLKAKAVTIVLITSELATNPEEYPLNDILHGVCCVDNSLGKIF